MHGEILRHKIFHKFDSILAKFQIRILTIIIHYPNMIDNNKQYTNQIKSKQAQTKTLEARFEFSYALDP